MKNVFFYLISILLCLEVMAQNGPGGIGNNDGHSKLALWLDACQIQNVSNGNNIAIWEDASGYENHATQAAGSKPNFVLNSVNGMPSVIFDGLNAHLEGTIQQGINAPATIYAVANFSNANQGTDDNDYIFSLGSGTSAGQHTSLARRKANPAADLNKFYSWDGANVRFGPSISANQWIIFGQEHHPLSTFHRLYFNGTAQTVADYASSLQTDGAYEVGKWIQLHQHHLDGHVAEIIVFDSLLNDAETNILHSYLNAKYSIAVASDKFNGDDVINGDNDLHVAGIGVEANGSQLSSASEGLYVELNSNFQIGDYLMFGHHVDSNFIDENATDASGALDGAWSRAWYFNTTDLGALQRVDLEFDITASGMIGKAEGDANNYKLLYRTGSTGNWTILADADYYQNSSIFFEDVIVSNNGYYTIGSVDLNNNSIGFNNFNFGNDGPGGIGSTDGTSSLKMWLSANSIIGTSGDPVVDWRDLSGSNAHANQPNFIELPSLQTNVLNGNSVIRFDGVNDYMRGTFTSAIQAPVSIATVAYFESINQASNDNDYVISIGRNGSLNEHSGISRRRNNVAADINKYYSWDGSVTRFGPVLTGRQWVSLMQEQDTSLPYHQLYLNGGLQSVTDYTSPFATTAQDFRLGRYVGDNTGNYLNGDVAEVIVFDKVLNSAERNILQSYLGAKYTLTVSNDKYDGDDVSNGNNDVSVAGIGREIDGDQLEAVSDGIQFSQNAGFATGDYLLFGHRADTNSISLTDIGVGSGVLEARWKRTWYLDVTNVGATQVTDIEFDFSAASIDGLPGGSASNYLLLFRSGLSGNWTVLANGTSFTGDQVVFHGVSIASNGHYTLGTSDHQNSPIGPSLDFGNNYWNVFAYSGNNFDFYAGSYIHDSLSFDSRDFWASNSSPSDYSKYQGAVVSSDNHSVTYKRRSFPCGSYQINISDHADDAELILNGVSVWQHSGCCDSHSNVWNGVLDGDSEVEIRWKDLGGDSYLAVDFITSSSETTWLGNSTNWFSSSNWSGGSIPLSNSNVLIPSGLTNWPEINSAGAQCKSITLKLNARLDITTTGELTVNGNWHNESKFASFLGKISFQSACGTSSITSSFNQEFEDLIINHGSEVILQEGGLTISNSLSLLNGNFKTNDLLTLKSNASGTAYIPEIAGGSITGSVSVERYIDAGGTNWRFLTAPVSGNTLLSWNEDFITSGFTGSDYPSFPFISIYSYDESTAGSKDNGYEAPSSINDLISPGKGFWVWCGDQLATTQSFTIDVTGIPNTGDVALPVSYTSNAGSLEDGWNMVGNPYPCSIDWDAAGWTKTNVNDAIYIWDPDNKQYASYVGGMGTNGGVSTIASSQAFWVQTNGTSPSLTARENVKVNTDQAFLRQRADTTVNGLRIRLSGNGLKDETLILFDSLYSNDFDAHADARKLYSSDPHVPHVLTVLNDVEYAINSIQPAQDEFSLSLKTKVNIFGFYQLDISRLGDNLLYSCLVLEDTHTGVYHSITSVDTSFRIALSDTTTASRFRLHFGGSITASSKSPDCHYLTNGEIMLKGQGEGPWLFQIQSHENGYLDSIALDTNRYVFTKLASGTYDLKVKNNGVCKETSEKLKLLDPDFLEANFLLDSTITPDSGFVEIAFTNISKNARNFQWQFDNGESSVEVNPKVVFKENRDYRISLLASSLRCTDSTARTIQVKIKHKSDDEQPKDPIRTYLYEDYVVIQGSLKKSLESTISIFNIGGQLLYRKKLMGDVIHERIPVSFLAKGVLTVSVDNKEINQVTKIVNVN